MNLDILPKVQRNLWKALADLKEIESFYLAGGTAIALYLKHRESIDFDFFRSEAFHTENMIRELSKIGTVTIESQSKDSLVAYVSNVKISFFKYPYSLIAPLQVCGRISVADLKDIAAMKIIAIAQRGVKKDFIDLHAILNAGWNLEAIFQCVDLKYPNQKYNKLHLLKSLTYFVDAEGDPMPKMLIPVLWKDVKNELEAVGHKFASS